MFAVVIASLVLAVVKGQEWGWGNGRILSALLVSLLLGVYFVVRSSRQRTPVIDLSLLRIRAFALSNGVTVVMAAGFYAYTLCNVLFLTTVWRYSVLTAGLALTPGPFTAMAIAGPASRLVQRVGHRVVVVPGALIWGAGMVYFATSLGVTPDFLGGWLPGMLILGVGAGLTFPTLSGAAVGSVPGPRFAVATSLNSVARQLGAALGVAVLIAIIGTPAPLQALHAFEHGWLFSGGCFLVGALACSALEVGRAGTRDTLADEAPEGLMESSESMGEGALLDDRALPHLAELDGEHALGEAQTVAEFLSNVPVFAPLSDAMRAEIAELARAVSLKRDEWLFRQDDYADSVYIVRLGQLEVIREGPEPERVNTVTRGAVLGELALLSDSSRTASVRALRDTELLQITRAHFESLLRSEPELTLSLARALAAQLRTSRMIPLRRGRPVTLALRAVGDDVPLIDLADELSRMLCTWGRVAVLHPGDADAPGALLEGGLAERMASHEAVAKFTPLVERCELDHDQVILVCGGSEHAIAWDEFCLARADKVLVAVGATGPDPNRSASDAEQWASLRGCDLLGYGIERESESMAGWMAELAPVSTFAVRTDGHLRGDMARMARRLAGRAVGVVLSGGGARAFAHLGVIEMLQSAGVIVDRVGGVSMGAFIGGLLACGHDSHAIDVCCYEEWVRRNPLNDYTLPRTALIKGHKARSMLERVYGDVRIEELDRAFYCCERRPQEQLPGDRQGRPALPGRRMQYGAAFDRAPAAARRARADRRLPARQPSARPDDVHGRGPGSRRRHQGWRGANPGRRQHGRAPARKRGTATRAPAVVAGNDIPHRPPFELQHDRGRAAPRRLHDRGARLGRGAARVSPDRSGQGRGASSRVAGARGGPVLAVARARADLRSLRPTHGRKGVSPRAPAAAQPGNRATLDRANVSTEPFPRLFVSRQFDPGA